jgi:ABC-type cobalamin/Fe3+-siderophores transport system ATPase subunit
MTAAQQAGEEVTSEAAAFADIVAWSGACPEWQRDALRRLCLQGELDGPDIDALTAICKGLDGHVVQPLDTSHVRDPAAAAVAVVLKGVHGVQHVNALAEGEQLTFDKIGVTVVYGDNGSGKSGYARILKKACRARVARGEVIHQNIYANKTGLPTATVEFTVNGAGQSEVWTQGKEPDPLLSAVSVFDSRAANVHVDQTNNLAYTPQPIRILTCLVQACQTIRDRLNTDARRLKDKTPAAVAKPACTTGTRVGKLMQSLAIASVDEVNALAVLSEEEKARLATLNADLASDPTRTGRQIQALKARLDATIERVESLVAAVADDRVDAARSTYRAHTLARAAAQAASTALFSEEPLPNVGSDVWRELWQAARTYSEREGYPDQPFPVTGNGSRCVLCLQVLEPEAANRLTRFEAFVKDESKRREADALSAYEAARGAIQVSITKDDRKTLDGLISDEVGRPELAAALRATILTALWRSRFALRTHKSDPAHPLPHLEPPPLEALRAASEALKTRATALLSDSGSDARKKLVAERDELADRAWLAGLKDDVIAEIGRRAEIVKLDKAVKDTATNRITTKSSELADKLVTNTLRAQFAQEVDRLGVAGLAIELRKERSEPGVPLFRVSLIKKPTAKVGDVLSEGEYRCVALAAFMAELATGDAHSTIVFDDPVSSLDHMHRDGVANRLAAEGARRQVIVLTHDIAFLFLLTEFCRANGTHIAYRSINRGTELAGFCQPNPPPNAQPVDKVIESLQKQLDNTKIHHERGNKEEWYRTVRSLQEQLRTTWERCVEDALSPVVRRLANKIDTKGLAKVTVVTIEDCQVMRDAFGRCSNLLHSVAEALNPPLPAPAVIEAEIKILRDWMAAIRNRQAKVKDA